MDQKTNRKQNPSEFLRQIIGKPVVVKLNSGVDYRGILACLDGYMNIALEQTEEYVNGQVMSKKDLEGGYFGRITFSDQGIHGVLNSQIRDRLLEFQKIKKNGTLSFPIL